MSTLNDLVYDVLSYMNGFGKDRDKDTYLTSTLNIADLTFTVDEALQVDRGIVEIDDEQLAVRNSEETSGTVTIMPYGRGMNGTTVAIHQPGARVVSNPEWPTSQIRNEINRAVQNLFPDLFAVKSTTVTFQPMKMGYALPADCYSVISASSKTLGPSGRWMPITKYSYDPISYAGQYPTERSFDILQSSAPGQLVKVIYRTDFGQFVNGTDTLASIGVQEQWRDLITMDVQARLVGTLDVQRLQLTSVESADRAQYNQPVLASQVSKSLMQEYKQRKMDERKRLLQLHSGRTTRTV